MDGAAGSENSEQTEVQDLLTCRTPSILFRSNIPAFLLWINGEVFSSCPERRWGTGLSQDPSQGHGGRICDKYEKIIKKVFGLFWVILQGYFTEEIESVLCFGCQVLTATGALLPTASC
eukprot:1341879-Amorphochlora_amoeboformis.AAC.2